MSMRADAAWISGSVPAVDGVSDVGRIDKRKLAITCFIIKKA
jgi:hypothetical protein